MTAVYATLRSQASNVTFAATSGGSLTGSGTLYFTAYLRSRAGINGAQTIVRIDYTAGQRIRIVIAALAISAAEVGSAHEVVIGASATNDLTAMVRVASFSLLQANQTTQISLPTTLYLAYPEHINLSASVTNQAALPTTTSLINGMVRQITAPTGGLTAGYYKYDSAASSGDIAASTGYWSFYYPWTGAGNGFTTSIGSSTENPGGCDYPLQSVGSDALPLPAYNPSSGASTPLRVAIQNGLTEDGGNGIEALAPIGMIALANGVNQSAEFSGAIDVDYLGLCRKSDGTIDTSKAFSGRTVSLYASNANNQENAQGNPTLSSYATTNLTFPQAVPRGYFALFSVRFNTQANTIAQLVNGEDITIYFDAVGDVGEYSPLAEAIGDTVLNYSDLASDGHLRILPAANSVVSQPGLGVFNGYIARRSGTRAASLTVADTAGQKVAISGTTNGQIIVRQPSDTLLVKEALRAIVSTLPGTADATAVLAAFSGAVSVGASGTITLTLTYPTGIRANYPDVIAGTTAPFNAPRLKVYLKIGGVITEQTALITTTGTTQNITITTNSGSTVGALPTNANASFCLFNAPAMSAITAGTGGSLASGSYQVAVVPHFPASNTQASSISHKVSDGCVPEILTDLATAIGGAKGYTATTDSFMQPAVGSSVTVPVGLTDFFGINQPVFVVGGGGYKLTSKTSNTLTLLRSIDNGSDYAATGGTVASDGLVVPGGQNGLTGATGALNGLSYTFSNLTSGTPATGALQLNNATPASATTIRLSESDRLSASTVNFLNALTPGSLLQIGSDGDKSVYHWYTFASQVDNGTDRTLTVTYSLGSGSLVNASNVTLAPVLAGAPGTAATVSVGTTSTLSSGSSATVSNSGSSSAATFNFGIPAGSPGTAATIAVGTVTGLSAGATPTVTNAGSSSAATFNFGIPAGNTGTAATIAVGTVTTGAAGSSATVSNAGTTSAAVFNFAIPQGSPGTLSATSSIGLTQVSSAPSGAATTATLFDLSGVLSWIVNTATTVYTVAALNLVQVFTKAQTVAPVAISISSGNASTDASLSNVFTILPATSFTLTNPTNLADGQTLVYKIKPSADGVVITYGSKFKFPAGAGRTLTGSSGSRDRLTCIYDGTDDVLDCVLSNGFG